MKKNFMAIASLLIAAMFLVVSCSQEVAAPKNQELVEARIGLGRSAKDITINTNGNKTVGITYVYNMTPAWSADNTEAPIYGKVENGVIKVINTETRAEKTTFTIEESVSDAVLGKVTPGLWNIHVQGYTSYSATDSTAKKLVLEGKATAYFNGSGTKATVFVAPVSSTNKVSVTINLKMQDLEKDEYNKIGYSFTNLNQSSVSSDGTEAKSHMTPTDDTTLANIKKYSATVEVESGFNTVTFSLPGYTGGKGGITKTFLAIPGVAVTIDGSVTPAEFKEGKADIKVLSINGGNVSVDANSGSERVVETSETINNKVIKIHNLKKDNSYKFTYTNDSAQISAAIEDGYNAQSTYQWYVGDTPITGKTESTYDFTGTKVGDYNVTCVETVTYTKTINGEEVKHQLLVSGTMTNVRVLETLPSAGSTTQNQ